jgi:hypothetical protein
MWSSIILSSNSFAPMSTWFALPVAVYIFLIDVSHAAIHSGDTSAQTYYYYTFNAVRLEDVLKFTHEFGEVLVMPIMLEVVMRVCASGGAFSYLNFS